MYHLSPFSLTHGPLLLTIPMRGPPSSYNHNARLRSEEEKQRKGENHLGAWKLAMAGWLSGCLDHVILVTCHMVYTKAYPSTLEHDCCNHTSSKDTMKSCWSLHLVDKPKYLKTQAGENEPPKSKGFLLTPNVFLTKHLKPSKPKDFKQKKKKLLENPKLSTLSTPSIQQVSPTSNQLCCIWHPNPTAPEAQSIACTKLSASEAVLNENDLPSTGREH